MSKEKDNLSPSAKRHGQHKSNLTQVSVYEKVLKDVLDLPLQHFFCAIWRLTVSGNYTSSLTYGKYASDWCEITFLVIHPNIPKNFRAILRLTLSGNLISSLTYGKYASDWCEITFLVSHQNIPKIKFLCYLASNCGRDWRQTVAIAIPSLRALQA